MSPSVFAEKDQSFRAARLVLERTTGLPEALMKVQAGKVDFLKSELNL